MRVPGLFLFLIGLTMTAWAADASNREPLTVAQLEQMVTTAHASDHDLAHRLSGLELTERLNADKRTHLAAAMPGEQSRAALTVLADLSQFLDPPAEEIVPTSPPDAAARVQIFNRAMGFVQSVMHSMPNFFATRETTRFESRRRIHQKADSVIIQDSPFRSTDRARTTVLYRDGAETVEQEGRKRSRGLTSWGEFGPFLGVIAADMLKGKVTFHHWERGSAGPLAIFDFSVPLDHSNYVVRFCCSLHFEMAQGKWKSDYELQPAYHGRVAIDPTSGAIRRLVVSADLDPEDVLSRADLAIEYGTVELGGKNYICPLRSVAVSIAAPRGADENGTTSLNHTTFEDYHLFRGDLRMVPDADGPKQP